MEKAVLRSSIREFLCSEAMHALGVPTTRALSLHLTGQKVMRDMFYDGNPIMEPERSYAELPLVLFDLALFKYTPQEATLRH